jgi:hypothetical protein
MIHLIVHYLDNVRGSTAASCEGNGPESIVEIVVGVVVWQKLLGPRVKAWHQRGLEKHHAALRDHVTSELERLAK